MAKTKAKSAPDTKGMFGLMAFEDIKPYPGNPYKHPRKQLDQIKGSLKKHGWGDTLTVDPKGRLIKGHGTLEAAKLLVREGGKIQDWPFPGQAPVYIKGGLTKAQASALGIALNELGRLRQVDDQKMFEEVSLIGLEDPGLLALTFLEELPAPPEEPPPPDLPPDPSPGTEGQPRPTADSGAAQVPLYLMLDRETYNRWEFLKGEMGAEDNRACLLKLMEIAEA